MWQYHRPGYRDGPPEPSRVDSRVPALTPDDMRPRCGCAPTGIRHGWAWRCLGFQCCAPSLPANCPDVLYPCLHLRGGRTLHNSFAVHQHVHLIMGGAWGPGLDREPLARYRVSLGAWRPSLRNQTSRKRAQITVTATGKRWKTQGQKATARAQGAGWPRGARAVTCGWSLAAAVSIVAYIRSRSDDSGTLPMRTMIMEWLQLGPAGERPCDPPHVPTKPRGVGAAVGT